MYLFSGLNFSFNFDFGFQNRLQALNDINFEDETIIYISIGNC